METHGSESYYVIGEGLLTESVGGRTLAVAAAAPPFRFSRMGPRGRALGEANRKKIALAMTAGGGGTGPVPAGYTYLGQFVDHDLTFDRTQVTLGQHVSPADLLQARSPTLDLDSLYGAGPTDPGVGEVLQRRPPPEAGQDGRDRPRPGLRGPRPAARRRLDAEGQAPRDHPRPAQRREPGRRPDAPGDGPLPQPDRRHAAGVGPGRAALRQGARAGGQALPVDAAPRLPAADLRGADPRRRVHERPQGVRAQRGADRRADDADRVLGRRLPARPQHDPARLQLEQALPRHRRRARSSCSTSAARAGSLGGFPRLPSNWIADFRRLYDFAGEAGKANLAAAGRRQPRDADRHVA